MYSCITSSSCAADHPSCPTPCNRPRDALSEGGEGGGGGGASIGGLASVFSLEVSPLYQCFPFFVSALCLRNTSVSIFVLGGRGLSITLATSSTKALPLLRFYSCGVFRFCCPRRYLRYRSRLCSDDGQRRSVALLFPRHGRLSFFSTPFPEGAFLFSAACLYSGRHSTRFRPA